MMKARVAEAVRGGAGRIPWVAPYARARGWAFVLSWAQRITGLLLVRHLFVHILTLSRLLEPASFDAAMRVLRFFLFAVIEWALAVPVIYHALNGGRVLAFESFGARNEAVLTGWSLTLAAIFIALSGFLMLIGNQGVAAFFFWVSVLIPAAALSWAVTEKVWRTPNPLLWRLHRISGAFLLVMIPAHFVFMHLAPDLGHDAATVIERMRSLFMKLVDAGLLSAALLHGGAGVLSVAGDYVENRAARTAIAAATAALMLVFGVMGLKLILFV